MRQAQIDSRRLRSHIYPLDQVSRFRTIELDNYDYLWAVLRDFHNPPRCLSGISPAIFAFSTDFLVTPAANRAFNSERYLNWPTLHIITFGLRIMVDIYITRNGRPFCLWPLNTSGEEAERATAIWIAVTQLWFTQWNSRAITGPSFVLGGATNVLKDYNLRFGLVLVLLCIECVFR